jgi:hypothetical protein
MDKDTKCMGVGCNDRHDCYRFASVDLPCENIMFRGTLVGMEGTGCEGFYSVNDGLYDERMMRGLTPKQVHSKMAELAGGHKEILKKYGYGK